MGSRYGSTSGRWQGRPAPEGQDQQHHAALFLQGHGQHGTQREPLVEAVAEPGRVEPVVEAPQPGRLAIVHLALQVEPLLTDLHPAVGPGEVPLQRFAQMIGVDGDHHRMIPFAQVVEQQRRFTSELGDRLQPEQLVLAVLQPVFEIDLVEDGGAVEAVLRERLTERT